MAQTARPSYGDPLTTTTLTTATNAQGRGQTHDNMQPFLTVNYVIALTGIYPSRS